MLCRCAFLLAAIASVARAEELPEGGVKASAPRRVLAGAAAVVPGIVVPGLGHFVAGEPQGGRRLLLAGGIGLGTGLAGAVGLALTGASPKTVAPFAAAAALGVGTLATAVLSDLYGVIVPPSLTGRAPERPPALAGELGLRYVYDPTFSYRVLVAAGLDAGWGRARVSPSAWVALDDDNQLLRLAGGHRLLGGAAHDGSHLEVEVAAAHHRYGSAAFSTTTGEISLAGRLDLHHLAPSLRGAFAELGAGVAIGAVRYHDLTTEPTEILLVDAAFGFYLGRAAGGYGEVALTYEHRHDGFAAGLKLPGLGSGPAGHFGVRGLLSIRRGWGVLVEAQAGSAYIVGTSVVFRQGGLR